MRRRHHCRSCGALACDTCTKNKKILTHIDSTKPLRVCDQCYSREDVDDEEEEEDDEGVGAGDDKHVVTPIGAAEERTPRTQNKSTVSMGASATSITDLNSESSDDEIPIRASLTDRTTKDGSIKWSSLKMHAAPK